MNEEDVEDGGEVEGREAMVWGAGASYNKPKPTKGYGDPYPTPEVYPTRGYGEPYPTPEGKFKILSADSNKLLILINCRF